MVIIIFKAELVQKKLKTGFRAYWQGQSEKTTNGLQLMSNL